MMPEATAQNARTEVAMLLAQLHPAPTDEWVAKETDAIMAQFNPPPRPTFPR
jgi:hypothetical protein